MTSALRRAHYSINLPNTDTEYAAESGYRGMCIMYRPICQKGIFFEESVLLKTVALLEQKLHSWSK